MQPPLRTQRVLGKLIEEGQEAGEIVKRGQVKNHANQYKSADIANIDNGKKTLKDLGITSDQSSDFQKLASIPEEIFEEFIQQGKAREMTLKVTSYHQWYKVI